MDVDALTAKLSQIEPTEEMYAGLGPEDVPALQQLLSHEETWMAARAVFALSRIGDATAIRTLSEAAADPRPELRVAVAAAAAQGAFTLPDAAVERLLEDEDAGVRKFAASAVKRDNGERLHALLRRVAAEDPIPAVRENAADASSRLG